MLPRNLEGPSEFWLLVRRIDDEEEKGQPQSSLGVVLPDWSLDPRCQHGLGKSM